MNAIANATVARLIRYLPCCLRVTRAVIRPPSQGALQTGQNGAPAPSLAYLMTIQARNDRAASATRSASQGRRIDRRWYTEA